MTKLEIIRAWKDEDYRHSLSESDRALLPQDPAGLVELADQDLGGAQGGCVTVTITLPICDTSMFAVSCTTVCTTIVAD